MPNVTLSVKWGRQKLEVPVDTSDGAPALRAKLFALTGVPLERQKLMAPKAWRGLPPSAV